MTSSVTWTCLSALCVALLLGGPVRSDVPALSARASLEVGTNDFRISDVGTDGNAALDAGAPAVAYNSTDNEYLVVWTAATGCPSPPVNTCFTEVHGQRINATTGAELGTDDFQISDRNSRRTNAAQNPAVAYNSIDNEYLVVWSGDPGVLTGLEEEIFGQRIDAATGAEIGTNDFRISDMGPDGDDFWKAGFPAVTYNRVSNEYLVVWNGDDPANSDSSFVQIYGQRINANTGDEVGTNDFLISGVKEPPWFNYPVAVAHDYIRNEYLVVWPSRPGSGNDIYGQRINAATGAEIGANDFRISDMAFRGGSPAVAFGDADNEYLVVWSGNDDQGGMVLNEYEIFGQRIDARTGTEVGLNDFRISNMGPEGDGEYRASTPDVAYNRARNNFLVVWSADDDSGDLVDDEKEIYLQRIDASTGMQIGVDDLRLSDMGGPDGNSAFTAYFPALAGNEERDQYLVVWRSDDDTGDLVDGEFEIFGQRLILPLLRFFKL